LKGHGRSQRIGGGQEDDLLLQRPVKYRPHRPHRTKYCYLRDILRAVLTAFITREGGFTDRHRKYRPRVERTRSAVLRVFLGFNVSAVGAVDIPMNFT